MGLAKPEQPGNKPLGGKGIERADIENARRVLVHDLGRGRRQTVEGIAHRPGIGCAGWREVYRPYAALEELETQMILQMADCPAHSAMGHVQLVGGLGKTQEPGCGFKTAHGGEGWKLPRHGTAYM